MQQQLVDAGAVEVDDLDPPGTDPDVLTHVRDASEVGDDEASGSAVFQFLGVGQAFAGQLAQFLHVQAAIDQQRRASRMIMQVHDELVLEVPEAELAWARAEVPRLMAGVAQLKVPLLAEVGMGPNWEQAH